MENIIQELESVARYAIEKDNDSKKVASIIYSLLGSIRGGSLDLMHEVTYQFAKRERERLMIINSSKK